MVVCLLVKRHYGRSGHRDTRETCCIDFFDCPCLCGNEKAADHSLSHNNHQNVNVEQVPLNVNESNRSGSDHDSSEEDNTPNTVSERKQVRPEILQAIEAAKSLADAPAASRVNFMVTTIRGTKYKFDIEKEGKAANSRSGSMDNFDAATPHDRVTKTRSIKGPDGPPQRTPKIEVDDVD